MAHRSTTEGQPGLLVADHSPFSGVLPQKLVLVGSNPFTQQPSFHTQLQVGLLLGFLVLSDLLLLYATGKGGEIKGYYKQLFTPPT